MRNYIFKIKKNSLSLPKYSPLSLIAFFPYFDENFLSIKKGEIQIISIKIKVRLNFVLIIVAML